MNEIKVDHSAAPSAAPPAEVFVNQNVPPKKRIILPYVLLGIFLLTLGGGFLFFGSLFMPAPATQDQTVVIPKGSSVQEIATLLDEQGLLINKYLFRLSAYLRAKNNLKAGEYLIPAGVSVLDVTDILRLGKTVVRQLTVPEGLTSYEVTTLLNKTGALTGEITKIPEEGTLLPETYHFALNDTRQEMLARMQKDAAKLLDELWQARSDNLPLKSPREALILASIVEKETGQMAEERPLVAGVFINRLRLGMPLQSDPTVIYALTGGQSSLGRSLTHADLMTASPMNTYMVKGLPPTPICNPGKAALEAVLHPQQTDHLYFVANGSGGHAFAKTLKEHNDNVAAWLRSRKQ